MAQYESLVNRCKSHTIQDIYFGIPTFYEKGKHEQAITPDKTESKTKGNIKPGTYDMLISIGISNQTHKVWLENFQLKPDISYKVSINLNAGGIVYTGGNTDVKAMLLYPAGTAINKQGNLNLLKTWRQYVTRMLQWQIAVLPEHMTFFSSSQRIQNMNGGRI